MFSIVDVNHTHALGYKEAVQQRDTATLLPIIEAHGYPETEVWSDEWRAHAQISTYLTLGAHKTVNHSINFKDPVNDVHTNYIESYWNRVNIKLK